MSFVAQGDQDPEVRKTGGELSSPVNGVENPHPLPAGTFGSEFLSDDSVPGLASLDDAAKRRLHRTIERGHRRPVGLDFQFEPIGGRLHRLACRSGEYFGQLDEAAGCMVGRREWD